MANFLWRYKLVRTLVGVSIFALVFGHQSVYADDESVATSSSSEASQASLSSSNSQEASDAARLERRRIISDLDAKALGAKSSHQVAVPILPVLERCAPLSSLVADCKAAADAASAELDRKIERVSRERSLVPPTAPPQPINVTIIEHRDTYIVRSNKVIVRPSEPPTKGPRTPIPTPRKNPLPHIKSNIFK
jgi:hypothetical protein